MNKNCEQCGTVFESKRVDAKYCSDTCRKQASRGVIVKQVKEPESYEWLIQLYKETVAKYPSREPNIRAKIETLLGCISHGLTKV
jgi:hypothetical protein